MTGWQDGGGALHLGGRGSSAPESNHVLWLTPRIDLQVPLAAFNIPTFRTEHTIRIHLQSASFCSNKTLWLWLLSKSLWVIFPSQKPERFLTHLLGVGDDRATSCKDSYS